MSQVKTNLQQALPLVPLAEVKNVDFRCLDEEGQHLLSHAQMHWAARTINAATTIDELVRCLHKVVPLTRWSYHHFAAIGSWDYKSMKRYHAHNIPDALLKIFDLRDRHETYPEITAVFEAGTYKWFYDLLTHPYIASMRDSSLSHIGYDLVREGLCIPLFGPNSRDGYIFMVPKLDRDEISVRFPDQAQALAQKLHVRYCLMVEKLHKDVKLTAREVEVLELISFGKTNNEIADILDLSVNTIAGYVKSLYLKLEVTDRVSAAMRAQTIRVEI